MERQQIETLITIGIIGLGGFIGANTRYFLSGFIAEHLGRAFPWGTLIINFTGSSLLAVFIGWSGNHLNADPRLRLLIAIGFFGAYTTFSTFANESIALLQAGDWVGGFGNILVSNLICVLGAMVGLFIGSKL